MYELYPYFTNDGSVGLFSPQADDIYHSTYGALTEAYEKFVLPSNPDKYLDNKKEIKILDICFGIGYNTKSFLNYYFEKFVKKSKKENSKNKYNVAIDTDNNFNNLTTKETRNSIYNEKIYTDKFSPNIFIHALDNDKNLFFLSPFFKNLDNNKKNNKISFNQEKIAKMLSDKIEVKYKLNNNVNLSILKNIIKNNPEIFEDNEFQNLLTNPKYSDFFDKNMCLLFDYFKYNRYNNTHQINLKAFLHNIYYQHITWRYKIALETPIFDKIKIKGEITDARLALKNSKYIYDIVFLDAFTPAKCPCLWTIDFFRLLYSHLDADGIVLTYSNSANIRNAFLQAGFEVGKIFNTSANKFMGTVAVKNKELIIKNNLLFELSDYDLGLINTKAGIVYRDSNLNLDNADIIKNHEADVKASSLMSSSRYIKTTRGKNEV